MCLKVRGKGVDSRLRMRSRNCLHVSELRLEFVKGFWIESLNPRFFRLTHPLPAMRLVAPQRTQMVLHRGHEWNTFDTGGVCPACLQQLILLELSLETNCIAPFFQKRYASSQIQCNRLEIG
jgi:hypothetical protein